MTKKQKLIYDIVKIAILSLPTVIVLFLQATILNINAEYEMINKELDYEIVQVDEDYFIYTDNADAIMIGEVTHYNGKWGFMLSGDEILKVNKNYLGIVFNEETKEKSFENINAFALKKKQSVSIPITLVFSGIAVAIVVLVVLGKMKIAFDYPRTSVLVALILGTGILYVIDMLVASFFTVFLTATFSWGAYMIQYAVVQGKLGEKKAKEVDNELLKTLSAITRKRG